MVKRMEGTSPKFISRSEVLRHNSESDCWVIVRNAVYDLSDFLRLHPGGKHIILSRAGSDATSIFEVRHGNSPERASILETYWIGQLPVTERIDERAFDEPFMKELTARCETEGLYRVESKLRTKYLLLRSASIVAFAACMYVSFFTDLTIWLAIPLVICQAIIGTSLFGLVAHEHTHRHYPKNRLLRILLRVSWPIFWPFISQGPLRYEHNSHHVKIGDVEFDYEVAAFASLIRYSGGVPHQKRHSHQHLIARYLYPFYANLITTIGGVVSGFWTRHNRQVAVEHGVSIIMTLACYILLPHLFSDNGFKAILLYAVYQCCLFYGIYVGAAINHFIPPVMRPIPPDFSNNYAYYICANTSNFAVNSRLWFWYTGGFNIQIEHHLVPFVPVENLPRLTPIVKELCAKYKYPYNEYPDFSSLWQDHYSYLRILSNKVDGALVMTEVGNKKAYQAR